MTLPAWMFSPAWWIAFWCFVAAAVLVLLYFSIAATLRKVDDAEAELDASPHLWTVGNLRILHPGFHDPFDQDRNDRNEST